jgi:hypothetical protein
VAHQTDLRYPTCRDFHHFPPLGFTVNSAS